MISDTNINLILNSWASKNKTQIVQLLNKDMIPVAALYLNKLNIDAVSICNTNSSEKYYLYLNGIGIFFTYYRKVEE